MSSKLSDYIDRKLQTISQDSPSRKNFIIQSKKEFYAKEEAEEMIQDEYQRRHQTSAERQQKQTIEKTHQIITSEIQDHFNNDISGTETHAILEKIHSLEHKNKSQLFSAYVDESNYNTIDTNNYNRVQSQQDISGITEEESNQREEQNKQYKENEQQKPYTSISELSQTCQANNDYTINQQSYRFQNSFSPKANQSKPLKTSIVENNASNHNNQPRIYYKNNFSKKTKFLDTMKKDALNGTLKENLRNDLMQIVESYDQTDTENVDSEKVEDMILELNRLTQKSNGIVPSKSQSKIQQFVNNVEMQKLTYSQRVSKSPTKLNLNGTANVQKGLTQDQSINVNQKTLRCIINNTQSKVKQNLRSFKSPTSNKSSVMHSLERTGADSNDDNQAFSQTQTFPNPIHLKDQLLETLSEINARNLSTFLKRKALTLPQGDIELAYILILIVASVDEAIVLNNDKSDILQKSWDEMAKQLSNHGRVVYSLQKLRIMIERKEQGLKTIQKLQILKRFEERKNSISLISKQALPISEFINKIIAIFKQIQQIVKNDKQPGDYSVTTGKKVKYSRGDNNYQNFLSTKMTSPSGDSSTHLKQTSLSYKTPNGFLSNCASPSYAKSPQRNKPPTIQEQLLKQKQLAVSKSYQLQLDQAKSISQKQQQARDREMQLARLKLHQKYLLFQVDKQEKKRQESLIKEKEKQHMRYQAEFNSRLVRKEKSIIDSEKKALRERSLENTELKRSIRLREHEEELRINRENSEKSIHELQWKEKLKKSQKEKQVEEIKRKHQEILISKVRKNEVFLTSKEQELDERLKSQFDSASYKFKQLDNTESKIRQEIEQLQKHVKDVK